MPNLSRIEQELAIKLQDDGIRYRTQVEIPVTTADFYFSLESRPLLVFVDGRVHLGTKQVAKDEELRSLLRREDIESWNYVTTATRTRKETNFTMKSGTASPSWVLPSDGFNIYALVRGCSITIWSPVNIMGSVDDNAYPLEILIQNNAGRPGSPE